VRAALRVFALIGIVAMAMLANDMAGRVCRHILISLGLVLSAATSALADEGRDRICRVSFARAGRPSESEWQRLKMAAMARAKLSWSRRNEYELDHIIPRCLDGSNDPGNLQLQPWAAAKEKDDLEARVCRQYCAGALTLEQARARFKREWP
jgi:hypothetical protein